MNIKPYLPSSKLYAFGFDIVSFLGLCFAALTAPVLACSGGLGRRTCCFVSCLVAGLVVRFLLHWRVILELLFHKHDKSLWKNGLKA